MVYSLSFLHYLIPVSPSPRADKGRGDEKECQGSRGEGSASTDHQGLGRDGARPGRRAALVLVIGYGRAGELRQRVQDTR